MSLLTRLQVAKLLGVTPETLCRWNAGRGGPPCVRLTDGTVRYRKSDLDHWLRTRKWGESRKKVNADANA